MEVRRREIVMTNKIADKIESDITAYVDNIDAGYEKECNLRWLDKEINEILDLVEKGAFAFRDSEVDEAIARAYAKAKVSESDYHDWVLKTDAEYINLQEVLDDKADVSSMLISLGYLTK